MGVSERTAFILSAVLVIVALAALIIGLTFGLRTPAPPNGGSPIGPTLPTEEPTTDFPMTGFDSEFGAFQYAAVATDTIPCSKIGAKILANGGSATDAAVAAVFCVGVVNTHNSGIGGGHFLTIYDTPRGGNKKEVVTILAREHAPLAADRDMFVNDTDASSKGPLAIAVPGEVAGFYKAWEMFGKLPWRDLIEDSIKLARDGSIVEETLASAIRSYENDIRNDDELSKLYVKPDGTLLARGDTLVQPKLAATLERIADDPFSFYNGSLADDIIQELDDMGSIITKADLLAYEAKVKPAVNSTLMNGEYTVYGPTAPSSGIVYQYILNILDGYMFDETSIDGLDNKVLTYHRIMEAFKFAYAKRSEIGDEDYVDVVDLVRNLTSPDFAAAIRTRITDDMTHDIDYYEPSFDLTQDSGTSHSSVIAPDGSAVGITSTINLFFGSNMVGPITGIHYNDEMDDFSTPGTRNSFGVPASPANYIAPGKMPMSSMCPTLILDKNNDIVFVSGASGGTRITTGTSLVTMNSLWFNQHLKTATDEPRVHHQLVPNYIQPEREVTDQDLVNGLSGKGHIVIPRSNVGVCQSIRNMCAGVSDVELGTECLHAVSDARKGVRASGEGIGGKPDGY